MDWMAFVHEAVTGIWNNVYIMALIVIPIMVVLELARDMQILDRMANWLASPLKIFGFSPKAAFPLLVGIIFGIAYGAGVLIEEARSGRLSWKDLFLINVFLSICHAVVEDTALFMAVGADGLIILLGRFLAAILITFLISRTTWLEREKLKRSVTEMSCVTSGKHCC